MSGGAVAARLTLVGVVVLVLQLSMVSQVEVAGARGNIVLLVAITVGLESGSERGAIAGFVLGLAFDLFLETPAGLSALTLALVGWGMGVAKDVVLRSSTLLNLALVAAASVAGTLLYAALAVLFGVTVDPTDLPAVVTVIAVVNVALSRPLHRVLRWAVGPEARPGRPDRMAFPR